MGHAVHRHRSVDRFLDRHPELLERWPDIESELATNPYGRSGSDRIVHLKGRFQCNFRLREGDYRFLYEVLENEQVVWVYDADSRGQVYR